MVKGKEIVSITFSVDLIMLRCTCNGASVTQSFLHPTAEELNVWKMGHSRVKDVACHVMLLT